MIKDSDLILWFQSLLLDVTTVGSRVFAWRKTPIETSDMPYINIVLPQRVVERGDTHSRGVRKSSRRIAVAITAKGTDLSTADSDDQWVIKQLDDIEAEVIDLLDYDHMPSGAPAGTMTVTLTDVSTERDETNELVGTRYLIFEIIDKSTVNRQ